MKGSQTAKKDRQPSGSVDDLIPLALLSASMGHVVS